MHRTLFKGYLKQTTQNRAIPQEKAAPEHGYYQFNDIKNHSILVQNHLGVHLPGTSGYREDDPEATMAGAAPEPEPSRQLQVSWLQVQGFLN